MPRLNDKPSGGDTGQASSPKYFFPLAYTSFGSLNSPHIVNAEKQKL